ncbi:MAG: UDP-N-acetylmuramate dehydrogenase [Flavobacteriaceae bacterium]|nr:UDP-N-acetylmuramate dehydrogenase [Flavobacteriaceae bacterium]
MKLHTQHSLKALNTFGIDQTAENFVAVESKEELKEALNLAKFEQKFILGGGSNLLLTQPIKGLCIHIALKGINVIQEDDKTVIVEAMAGENWHDFVCWTLEQGYGGLENLSLIPGNVGTSPIQNIGAYGVELKDIFESCTAFDRHNLTQRTFTREDAQFGYRSSFFKTKGKGQYVISAVQFRLTKKGHVINTSYGAIKEALGNKESTPQNIAHAVISIRQSKLPNPAELGNSGSFFKNPIISKAQFDQLLTTFPKLPSYPQENGEVKVPAGWLIDQLGFKGKRIGDAGVHKKQALVLVNYGNASGQEILALAQKIQANVKESFNISLEAEVNIL